MGLCSTNKEGQSFQRSQEKKNLQLTQGRLQPKPSYFGKAIGKNKNKIKQNTKKFQTEDML